MESTQESAIATLLHVTEAAHGAYETEVLGGVFDADWAAWYAKYLLDHGLIDHLSGDGAFDVATLTSLLTRLDLDYQQDATSGPWPDAYARGIIAAVT